jgi:cytoskeletal protein CcmA (bactofilin family)
LVPDFTSASDYIEDVEEEDAEQAYAPSEAYTPSSQEPQSPMTAVGQPYYQGEEKTDDDEDTTDASGMGVSLISKEATVLGDIITEGHIDIIGKVRGHVEAEGNVAVRGLVSGDLSGEKIGLYKCRVKGNLNAGTGVVIDSDSVIVGDVDTDNIVLGGKLKGDIKAVKMAVLRSDAYFIGDVETESIAVESGAVVNGSIRTMVQGDIEAPFDD